MANEVRTFRDYCETLGTTPIIPPSYPDYLADYQKNNAVIDIDAMVKYGSLLLVVNDKKTVLRLIEAAKLKNDYKWRTLYNTTIAKYDPVFNVEEHIDTETTYGEHITEQDIGERKKTSEYGDREQDNVYGERVTDSAIGARKNTGHEDGYNYPYDVADKKKLVESKDTEQKAEAASDKLTEQSHTDKTTDKAHTDNVTDQKAKDIETSRQHIDKVHTDRTGNIGTTAAQDLLEKERAVALFDFLEIVMKDVVDAVTIPLWDDREG